jgi:hypothetical protein
MKSMRLSILLVIVLSQMLFAQKNSDPIKFDSTFVRARIIKFNLLSPIAQTFSGAYENVLSPETSLQISIFINAYGFGVTPEYRYYLSETPAPRGIYIAPFLRYQEIDGYESTFGGGLVIGKQQIFKNKISIDAFFGPSYNTFVVDEVFAFGLRAGITIGFIINSKR